MSIAIKAAKAQGDPGLLGFLGKAARGLGSLAAKTLIPAPFRLGATAALGGVRSLVSPATGFQVPGRVQSTVPLAGARPGIGTPVTRVPGFKGALQRILPGGATGFETVGAGGVPLPPRGFHLNKTGYFLTSAAEFGTFVEPFSRFVRNRRRNPGNMRAADRAISRIESAKRMAKRLSRITVRKNRCRLCDRYSRTVTDRRFSYDARSATGRSQ